MDTIPIILQSDGLLDWLTAHGYSTKYQTDIKREMTRMERYAIDHPNSSFEEYYLLLSRITTSASTLEKRRQILGRIMQYHLYGSTPSKAHPFSMAKKDEFSCLPKEYQEFITSYCAMAKERGLRSSTIHSRRGVLTKFCTHLTACASYDFKSVTIETVRSYFYDGEKQLHGKDVAKVITMALKAYEGKAKADGIQRLAAILPSMRKHVPIYPFLTDDEANKISEVLSSAGRELSYRDKAIGIMFFYIGIRREDLSKFKLSYIDWENDAIRFFQHKNGRFNSIPLRPVVGNAIYDYLVNERPNDTSEYLFLTADNDHPRPLKGGSVYCIMEKIFKLAGVRTEGGRKGTHIFRHHLTRKLVDFGNDISMVSEMLGHNASASVNPYLQADFKSLASLGLSIAEYPIREEALT